jgi:hypothetical protein
MTSRRADLAIVLGLAVAAAAFTAGPFLARGTLYHDTLNAFSFYSDNLDSLNRFGEWAWWSANVNAGMPGYFYGMLGQPNLARPAFVSLGALAWGLGQLGIRLPGAHAIYVFHFGLLIPALFLLGVWCVALRLFRTRAALLYVLAVAAFSPGILVNLSDPGILENTAYALFCAAALLSWIGRPTRRSFAWLGASAVLLCVGASQMVLATAAPLLAALGVALLTGSRAARRSLRAVPIGPAVATVLLCGIALAPSAIAYRQQHLEIIRAGLQSLSYPYAELKSGNPLQLLVGSVPGIAFDWDEYYQKPDRPPSEYGIRSLAWGDDVGNNYLGLLATPLAAVGLLFGRRRIRVPLFLMLMITGAVYLMYGASTVFAPFLVALPPLRTLNHFGDMLHGGGAFLIVLFAAGLGLETLERRRDLLRRAALVLPFWSAAALALYLSLAEPPGALFGFAALLSAAFAILFFWASRVPRRTRSRVFVRSLVALTLVDVSTVAFWYLRGVYPGGVRVDEKGFGRSIGVSDDVTTRLARVFLLRETNALAAAQVAVDRIPVLVGFCAARPSEATPTAAQVEAAFGGPPAERRLPIARTPESEAVLAKFAAAPPPARCDVAIGRAIGSFNSVQMTVRAAQPALVFFRDGFDRYWHATVDGRPVFIHRALGAFKAIEVPAGASQVALRYRPPWIGAALVAAYAALLVAGLVAWRVRDVAELRK